MGLFQRPASRGGGLILKRQQRPDAIQPFPVARRVGPGVEHARNADELPALFHIAIEIKRGALVGYLVLAHSRTQAIDNVCGVDHAATIFSCIEVKRVSACAWTLNHAVYKKEEFAAIERTLVAMQDERAI